MLSVIIPTRNANTSLPGTIACLTRHGKTAEIAEIIIADGGSDVVPDVGKFGARLLTGKPGHDIQLAADAREAVSE